MKQAREIRGFYPNIPDHSDLRGFSYRAPANYEWSDDHIASGDQCREKREKPPQHSSPPSLWRSVKNFLGKGPKGYHRSDERIFEDVCEALMRHPGIDASEIEVVVNEGVVLLRGLVPDRWMKRAAEWVCEGISGVKDIQNELAIQRRPLRP